MSTLAITTIQTNLHWEDKAANLQMPEQKISNINEKTEVVVLLEMFSAGFNMKAELLAETAEEIALSIIAEIKAVFAGKRGVSLRDSKNFIH
jgi:omega-amidase